MTTSQEPIRLGVISFAHGHVSAYCRVIAGFADAEVVAAWDYDVERGQQASAEFGLEWQRISINCWRAPISTLSSWAAPRISTPRM